MLTFSRSGSLRARANSLLSITEAAATSRGVEPRMEGEAEEEQEEEHREERRRLKKETNSDDPEETVGDERSVFLKTSQ